MGYRREVIKGFSWSVGLRGVMRFITLLRISILARLLNPAQFGLFSIASLVLALVEMLTETGVNVFLVQEKEPLETYINTVWIVSIIRGTFIAVVIAITSPLVALFFNDQSIVLLLLLVSIVPLIRGFINPSEVIFQKELRFHQEFYFRSVIFLIESVVAVVLTFTLHSVTSLVIALIVSALVEVALSFLLTPRPRFIFHSEQFRKVIGFGKWVTSAGLFEYLFENGDNIVVGRMLGLTALGYYNNAYKISMLPITEVADVVSRVTLPVYAKFNDDKPRLKRALLQTIGSVSLITLPVGLFIFLFPSQIIYIILGPQWLPGAGVLQVLAIFGVVKAITSPAFSLFYAIGKQHYVTLATFISFAILAISIVPFVYLFGLLGAGYSAIFATIVSFPVVIYYLKKVL